MTWISPRRMASSRIDISIPPGDPDLSGDTIPMTRFVTGPGGTAVNSITGWIDGSQVYGSDAANAASLRLPDGHLKTSAGNNLPIVNGGFVSGDIRAAENPDLTTTTTLFVREHNFQVDRLQQEHPDWTGDQLYQMARAIVGAEIANITYTEFLPKLIGKDAISPYHGYDPTIDPRITQEFATAAFRVGHSIVSGEETKIDNRGVPLADQSLADAFFATPADVTANGGIDALQRDFAADVAQKSDVYAIDELRNLLFDPPVSLDLIAIDIQRERDLGLGTLNQTREALGLTPYTDFDQITSAGRVPRSRPLHRATGLRSDTAACRARAIRRMPLRSRFLRRAPCLGARTARAEPAAARQVAGIWRLAFQPEIVGDATPADDRHRGQQRLCIRMAWRGEHRLGRRRSPPPCRDTSPRSAATPAAPPPDRG